MAHKLRPVLILLFIALTMIASGAEGVFYDNEQRLFDDYGLFTEDEAESLNEILLETENEVGFYVSMLIADDNSGGNTNADMVDYVDVYYENEFGIDTDGVMLLISFSPRYYYVSTSGIAIRYLTDDRIEDILDYIYDQMKSGDYYNVGTRFSNRVKHYGDLGIPSNQYNYDTETGDYDYYNRYDYYDDGDFLFGVFYKGDMLSGAACGGIIALIISGIIVLVSVSNYKVKRAKRAVQYLNKSSVRYHQKSDTFIKRYVTKTRINTDSGGGGGGGGSSTHTSSGGGTHGGGGRSF